MVIEFGRFADGALFVIEVEGSACVLWSGVARWVAEIDRSLGSGGHRPSCTEASTRKAGKLQLTLNHGETSQSFGNYERPKGT